MNTQRLATLHQLLEQTPGDPFLLYAIALEFASGGEIETAVIQLQKLQHDEPEYLATYYQLGKLLEGGGQEEEAAAVYRLGIQLARKLGDSKTQRELQAAFDLL